MNIKAIKCPSCGDTVFSRARHDMRGCSCGGVHIDGGFDYQKVSWNSEKGGQPEGVDIVLDGVTKADLFHDWNTGINQYGIIPKEETVVRTSRRKPTKPRVYGRPTEESVNQSIKRQQEHRQTMHERALADVEKHTAAADLQQHIYAKCLRQDAQYIYNYLINRTSQGGENMVDLKKNIAALLSKNCNVEMLDHLAEILEMAEQMARGEIAKPRVRLEL